MNAEAIGASGNLVWIPTSYDDTDVMTQVTIYQYIFNDYSWIDVRLLTN